MSSYKEYVFLIYRASGALLRFSYPVITNNWPIYYDDDDNDDDYDYDDDDDDRFDRSVSSWYSDYLSHKKRFHNLCKMINVTFQNNR